VAAGQVLDDHVHDDAAGGHRLEDPRAVTRLVRQADLALFSGFLLNWPSPNLSRREALRQNTFFPNIFSGPATLGGLV
jgi:hypothetical protein